jgi:NADH dehydrogenase
VIIGAGPTGVELAGTIAELARDTLQDDFRNFDTRDANVVLIEAGSRILPGFSDSLAAYAHRALTNLGVEIKLGQAVSDCIAGGVRVGGQYIRAKTILWGAGVAASPAAEWLHVPADRAGRVLVEPDLTVPGHANIFVIGDTAHVEALDGKLVPGIAPAAKQEGRYVAEMIKVRLRGAKLRRPFRYKNVGSLATIGKRAAVVDFGWIKLTGRLAWWIWGVAHIYFLIGLRHRLAVALSWLWIYITGQRSARLITQDEAKKGGIPV